MVVCGSGATLVNIALSCGVLDDRSVRTSLANRIAPSTFNSPVPCSSMLKPLIGPAVYIRIILIMLGVSLGLAWSKRAAVPATTGVAIEVPLRYINRLLLSLVNLER